MAAVGLGAVLGVLVAAIGWLLRPAAPALGPALHRLRPHTAGGVTWQRPVQRMAGSLVDRLVPTADLALLGYTRTEYVKGLVWAGSGGLVGGPLMSLMLGPHLPFVVPGFAGLALAALTVLVTHRGVHRRAEKARVVWRRAICVYLDEVAQSVAAGQGPVEALETAALIPDGPVFDRIRKALQDAQLQLEPPWEHLRTLARDLRVAALGDVADVMANAAENGGQVYGTLRKRVAGLRDEIRNEDLEAAETNLVALETVGGLLLIVILALALFPLLTTMPLN